MLAGQKKTRQDTSQNLARTISKWRLTMFSERRDKLLFVSTLKASFKHTQQFIDIKYLSR